MTKKKIQGKRAKQRRGQVPTTDKRKKISNRQDRSKQSASFPIPPSMDKAPKYYSNLLGDLKNRIQRERLRTVLSANAGLILLYWDIGRTILQHQEKEGWGAKIIDRLAHDLRKAFPNLMGFSPRNLKYMRAFSAAWPKKAIVQETLAQIPWYHHIALLAKLDHPAERLWYVRETAANGWSHNILVLQIQNNAHKRQGKALSNFHATLPPPESDLAAQVFKDPYLFDFLGTADPRREAEVEKALVDHVQQFLLELGSGFSFVGRQVPLEIGNQEFRIDLLFYHLKLRSYVVIELKSVPFEPAFIGQLNMYLSATDDLLRHADDKPTIGLFLCRSKNKIVVEYALRNYKRPIGVSEWEIQMVEKLPKNLRGNLPTVEEIEKELG